MNAAERSNYFSKRWPAACRGQRWNHRDQALRRRIVLECMRHVRGPAITTSDARWGRDETTALFCYLDFLAHPDSLDKSARWADCQVDYRAFNRAKQADYYEVRAYGPRGSKRLRKQRFSGRQTAAGEPLEAFSPEAIRQRFVTMASRAQKKARTARKGQKVAGQKVAASPVPAYVPGRAVPPAGSVILLPFTPSPVEVAVCEPDPAYVPPDDQPF